MHQAVHKFHEHTVVCDRPGPEFIKQDQNPNTTPILLLHAQHFVTSSEASTSCVPQNVEHVAALFRF